MHHRTKPANICLMTLHVALSSSGEAGVFGSRDIPRLNNACPCQNRRKGPNLETMSFVVI